MSTGDHDEASASDDDAPIVESPLWRLPGLDKDTFYAAALYLHAGVGELRSKRGKRKPQTPEATRKFLDGLADCFAPSKLPDARDHVTATAMVRREESKTITIYMAKNQSEKGFEPFASEKDFNIAENTNESFATELTTWFNQLTGATAAGTGPQKHEREAAIFEKMCEINWSRLQYYIKKVCEHDAQLMESTVKLNLKLSTEEIRGWEVAKKCIEGCEEYWESKDKSKGYAALKMLVTCASSAGEARRDLNFRSFRYKVETALPDAAPKISKISQTVKWIGYLGRLRTSYLDFMGFCAAQGQSGHTIQLEVLPSPQHGDKWTGAMYIDKIKSWTGDLELDKEREVRVNARGDNEFRSLPAIMTEVAEKSGNESRVHCEMQLLMKFLQPGAEKCEDYFGCSKKSCWLCWEMIQQHDKYSMKDTHRKIYPRWAFPYNFSPSQAKIAEGLRAAYNGMMSLLQEKVIKGTALETLAPEPQTSARMTPATLLVTTGQTDVEGLFSSNPITFPGPFPEDTIPVLYLPADDSEGRIRFVDVEIYKAKDGHGSEELLTSRHYYASGKVVFAFQLITRSRFLRPTMSRDDVEKVFWRHILFLDDDLNLIWFMFYRLGAGPNPHVLSVWKAAHDQIDPAFPWCGDVFIVLYKDTKIFGSPFQVAREVQTNKLFAGLQALQNHFQRVEPGYAARVEKADDDALEEIDIKYHQALAKEKEIQRAKREREAAEREREALERERRAAWQRAGKLGPF